uniref:Glycine N-acyltransferase-like protein n=1 Tax=Crassostrea virginica TaxID=6565 RepID=A0A8B8CJH1_CRAVI|nr:glycine N-acyltransferase-like protein 3 [Crassostrea virginica]
MSAPKNLFRWFRFYPPQGEYQHPSNSYGFTATCLKPEHVDFIVQAWPYSSNFTDCREWITEMIDLFPGVCILDSNGDPATWILQQEYGAIGMLEVVPKYRRAKLGSAATMLLAQRVCEDNYNVYSLVSVDNTASLAFHKRNNLNA